MKEMKDPSPFVRVPFRGYGIFEYGKQIGTILPDSLYGETTLWTVRTDKDAEVALHRSMEVAWELAHKLGCEITVLRLSQLKSSR